MHVTPYAIGERYLGTREIPGGEHNPVIVGWIQRAGGVWIKDDETAWCGAFAYHPAFELDLCRPKASAAEGIKARYWLTVGKVIPLAEARVGFDVVIFKRGTGAQPGPEVLDAPGHVAYFVARVGSQVLVLGGNQGNQVSVAAYPAADVIGVRRLEAA